MSTSTRVTLVWGDDDLRRLALLVRAGHSIEELHREQLVTAYDEHAWPHVPSVSSLQAAHVSAAQRGLDELNGDIDSVIYGRRPLSRFMRQNYRFMTELERLRLLAPTAPMSGAHWWRGRAGDALDVSTARVRARVAELLAEGRQPGAAAPSAPPAEIAP